MSTVGIVPDLLLAPKYSSESEVAAVMATKAGGINGMFGAKALVDLDTATANSYTAAVSTKADKGMTDANEIVCWPMATLGDRKLHMSCIVAGRMAATTPTMPVCPTRARPTRTQKSTACALPTVPPWC